MKCFPLDCTTECPHYKTWDLSVDDWTSVCDILNVQVDDCDGNIIRYRCPLDSDKRYQNALQEGQYTNTDDDKDSWKARALYAANKACENCEEYSEGLHKCGHCRIKKIKMDTKN